MKYVPPDHLGLEPVGELRFFPEWVFFPKILVKAHPIDRHALLVFI